MLASEEQSPILEELNQHLQEGKVTPIIDKTYPLDQVRAAMARFEAGDVRGKIAIMVTPSRATSKGPSKFGPAGRLKEGAGNHSHTSTTLELDRPRRNTDAVLLD